MKRHSVSAVVREMQIYTTGRGVWLCNLQACEDGYRQMDKFQWRSREIRTPRDCWWKCKMVKIFLMVRCIGVLFGNWSAMACTVGKTVWQFLKVQIQSHHVALQFDF